MPTRGSTPAPTVTFAPTHPSQPLYVSLESSLVFEDLDADAFNDDQDAQADFAATVAAASNLFKAEDVTDIEAARVLLRRRRRHLRGVVDVLATTRRRLAGDADVLATARRRLADRRRLAGNVTRTQVTFTATVETYSYGTNLNPSAEAAAVREALVEELAVAAATWDDLVQNVTGADSTLRAAALDEARSIAAISSSESTAASPTASRDRSRKEPLWEASLFMLAAAAAGGAVAACAFFKMRNYQFHAARRLAPVVPQTAVPFRAATWGWSDLDEVREPPWGWSKEEPPPWGWCEEETKESPLENGADESRAAEIVLD